MDNNFLTPEYPFTDYFIKISNSRLPLLNPNKDDFQKQFNNLNTKNFVGITKEVIFDLDTFLDPRNLELTYHKIVTTVDSTTFTMDL
mgnify:CR=1 FL=1